jgi:hypothetical protein
LQVPQLGIFSNLYDLAIAEHRAGEDFKGVITGRSQVVRRNLFVGLWCEIHIFECRNPIGVLCLTMVKTLNVKGKIAFYQRTCGL